MYYSGIESVRNELQSDSSSGLKDDQIEERIHKYGYNHINNKEYKSRFVLLLEQFKSPISILLLIAAAVSLFLSEWLDCIAILGVLFINAAIGFFMEAQAENSMKSLKKLTQTLAKVVRNGKLQEINSDNIVPGDLLYLEAGDMVSADARVIKPVSLQSNESSLTGESVPVEKSDIILPPDTPLAERRNMIYKGTFITKGNTFAIVTATGLSTELGKIASLVKNAKQEATPIEKKLGDFSKKLIWITIGLLVIIFIAGIINGQQLLTMLQTSIAMAVAALPEGLPIVATLALAYGMIKMAKQNVIVKKLAAVETLGGTSIICTDKTGTLTENKIEVSIVVTSEEKYFYSNSKPSNNRAYQLLLDLFVLCNTSELFYEKDNVIEIGDPLETGLLKFVHNQGISIKDVRQATSKIKEEPFSSETKVMATLYKKKDTHTVYAKGATEELIRRCSKILLNDQELLFDDIRKSEWLKRSEELSSQGLKVLAFAYKSADPEITNLSSDLVFLGIAGMIDPPRPEVPSAIVECKHAGIKVVMITGDHPSTAKNIGLRLGIINNLDEQVIHGNEMKDYEQLTAKDKQTWKEARIFARVSPKQKLDLVKVLQEDNTVVAMTGDGVNDAPALKKADIGIAMGKRGTQVAQEVADMILKDDSFISIVYGVRYGRIILENIQKFIMFLLSCNLSEIFIISTASVFNMHFQLFPLQILFINLVTDVLPALALGVSEGNENIMNKLPRKGDRSIINKSQWMAILIYSLVIMACCYAAVFLSHFTIDRGNIPDAIVCNNVLFDTLVLSQLLHVFNMSNRKTSFFRSEVFSNKYVWFAIVICLIVIAISYIIVPVREVLDLNVISFYDFLIVIAFSFLSLGFIQAMKKTNILL